MLGVNMENQVCQQRNMFFQPRCPQLRPNDSMEDFQEFNLEPMECQTRIFEQLNQFQLFQQKYVQYQNQQSNGLKRCCPTIQFVKKSSFDAIIDRPEKRPKKRIHW